MDLKWRSMSVQQTSCDLLKLKHEQVFNDTKAGLRDAFESMHTSMMNLELQLLGNVNKMQLEQQYILNTYTPSISGISEMEENIKKIERDLKAFTSYADNLTHIKLTLARACTFGSTTGNLSKLIVRNESLEINNERESEIPLKIYTETSLETHLETPLETIDQFSISNSLNNQTRLSPMHSFEINRQNTIESKYNNQITREKYSTCFIFYLPPEFKDEHLRKLFSKCGVILNVHVTYKDGKSRGYGFVDFSTAKEAQYAVSVFDKYQISNKILSVTIKV